MSQKNEIEQMAAACARHTLKLLKEAMELAVCMPDPRMDEDDHRQIDENLLARLALDFERILCSPPTLPKAVESSFPAVVYFKHDAQRREFIEIMRLAHPNLTAKKF